jgi:hypothetical protein
MDFNEVTAAQLHVSSWRDFLLIILGKFVPNNWLSSNCTHVTGSGELDLKFILRKKFQ